MIRYILFGVLAVSVQAENVLPQQYSFDRYQRMTDQSPFAIATAVTAAPAEVNFAKDLYIANAAHTDDGDMVTLASVGDNKFKEYLTTKEPVNGYSIVSIDWSEDVGKTTVKISKDGKTALLTFNQTLLASAIKTPAAAPIPGPVAAPTPILRLEATKTQILPPTLKEMQQRVNESDASIEPTPNPQPTAGPPKFQKRKPRGR
jgi:hypothetical protein